MTAPFFSNLLGGPLAEALPDERSRRAAQNAGLLRGGLSLLEASTRPGTSLGAGLLAGLDAGQQGYRQYVGDFMQQRQSADALQKQQMRDAIFERFAPPDDATPEQAIQSLRSMLPYLAYIGDPSVKDIVEYLKSVEPGDRFGVAGDRLYDKTTGKFLDDQGAPTRRSSDIVEGKETRDGQVFQVGVDKRTGEKVWERPLGPAEEEGGSWSIRNNEQTGEVFAVKPGPNPRMVPIPGLKNLTEDELSTIRIDAKVMQFRSEAEAAINTLRRLQREGWHPTGAEIAYAKDHPGFGLMVGHAKLNDWLGAHRILGTIGATKFGSRAVQMVDNIILGNIQNPSTMWGGITDIEESFKRLDERKSLLQRGHRPPAAPREDPAGVPPSVAEALRLLNEGREP